MKSNQLITVMELKQEFVEYLVKVQGLSEGDAVFGATGFPDPYEVCYLKEEYVGDDEVDGKKCEVRECCTDFSMMMTFNNDIPFRYKKYIFISGDSSHTVGEYRAAPKLYCLMANEING